MDSHVTIRLLVMLDLLDRVTQDDRNLKIGISQDQTVAC